MRPIKIELDTNQAQSQVIPINWRGGILTINIDIKSGSPNLTVQQTFDDIQNTPAGDVNWQNAPSTKLVGLTTSLNEAYEGVPTALRVLVNNTPITSVTFITITQRDM